MMNFNYQLECRVFKEDEYGTYFDIIEEWFHTAKDARIRSNEIINIYGSDLDQVKLYRFRNDCTFVSEKLLFKCN